MVLEKNRLLKGKQKKISVALSVVADGHGRVKVEYKINLNVFYGNTINNEKHSFYNKSTNLQQINNK